MLHILNICIGLKDNYVLSMNSGSRLGAVVFPIEESWGTLDPDKELNILKEPSFIHKLSG